MVGTLAALPLIGITTPPAAYGSEQPLAKTADQVRTADGHEAIYRLGAQIRTTGIPFGHLPNDPNDHPEVYGGPPHRPPPPPLPQLIDQNSPAGPGDC